jgi:hypothetical protein
VVGQVDEDVVGRVVGAVPRQLDALPSDLQGAAVREGLVRQRPGRVVVAQQELARLLVPDARDRPVEQRRRADVVGVVMGVDEVGDRLLTPLAAAISSTARWRLWPMVGGASSRTTPSRVVRKAD